MVNIWKNLKGTIYSIFGIGTVNLKDNTGTLEIRNEADDAFVNVSVAEPTITSHATTKNYVDTLVGTVNPDSTGTLKEVYVDITTTSPVETVQDIPASARVREVWLEITTAYSSGTTIIVGDSVDDDKFMTSGLNKPTKEGVYSIEQNTTANTTAGKAVVTIGGTPSAGAGTVIIRYAIP